VAVWPGKSFRTATLSLSKWARTFVNNLVPRDVPLNYPTAEKTIGELGGQGSRITQSMKSGSPNSRSDAAFAAESASWLSSLGIFQNSTNSP